MVFGRIFNLLFGSVFASINALICIFILCFLYQVVFLRRTAKLENIRLSKLHFVKVYIFLFYLMLVYRVTGMGTIWEIGLRETLIRMDEIYLTPFGFFEDITSYLLNILMTIPLGFLLPVIWVEFRSLKKVAIAGFCLSFAIELSQLLNRRATSVDDLIMNTLGAVVGYLIFKFLFGKVAGYRQIKKPLPTIIRYEPVFYLVLSFMGMFLFFGAVSSTHFGDIGISSGYIFVQENVPHPQENDGIAESFVDQELQYLMATILDVLENSIQVERIAVREAADGDGVVAANTYDEITIWVTEETIFEIWQSDIGGTAVPTVFRVSVNDIEVGDIVEIHGNSVVDEMLHGREVMLAKKIIIRRFNG